MRIALLVAFACLWLAAPAAAWKGELASGVLPIAEVQAKAESGDIVTVEGQITDVGTASGSRLVVTIEDATGSVLVRVPEHMLRNLNGGKDPEVGRKVRVSGKWGHAYLDKEIWGIEAQDAERVE
jgi:hypothetical protein